MNIGFKTVPYYGAARLGSVPNITVRHSFPFADWNVAAEIQEALGCRFSFTILKHGSEVCLTCSAHSPRKDAFPQKVSKLVQGISFSLNRTQNPEFLSRNIVLFSSGLVVSAYLFTSSSF